MSLVSLSCPKGCEEQLFRKDIEAHQDTCPLEPVACPFSELGCEAEVCRQDLEKHVEGNMQQHVSLIAQSHMALREEHGALQAEHRQLQSKHEVFQEEHRELQAEHMTLKADNTLLKDKMKAVVPILNSIPTETPSFGCQIAQLQTILGESSVKTGESLSVLACGAEPGLHYFVLNGVHKLKLEWEKQLEENTHRMKLELYSLVNDVYRALTPRSNFDVVIEHNMYYGSMRVSICCKESLKDASPNKFLHLLGTDTLRFYKTKAPGEFTIAFKRHEPSQCPCGENCHPHKHQCYKCGYNCERYGNYGWYHQCTYCGGRCGYRGQNDRR
jgi:hypothetical protein